MLSLVYASFALLLIGCGAESHQLTSLSGWSPPQQVQDCPEPLAGSESQLRFLLGAQEQPPGQCLMQHHALYGERWMLQFRNGVLVQYFDQPCYSLEEEAVILDQIAYRAVTMRSGNALREELREHFKAVIRPRLDQAAFCGDARPWFDPDRVVFQPKSEQTQFRLAWYLRGVKLVERSECGKTIPNDATGCSELEDIVAVMPRDQLIQALPPRNYLESAWPPEGDPIPWDKSALAAVFNIQDELLVQRAVAAIETKQVISSTNIGDGAYHIEFGGGSVVSKRRNHGAEIFDALYYKLDRLLGFGVVPASSHITIEDENDPHGETIMVRVPGVSIVNQALATLSDFNRYLAAAHTVSGWKAAIFHYLIDTDHGQVRNSVVLDDGRVSIFDLFSVVPPLATEQRALPWSFFFAQLSRRSRFPEEVAVELAQALQRLSHDRASLVQLLAQLYPDQAAEYAQWRAGLVLDKLMLLLRLGRLPSYEEAVALLRANPPPKESQ